MADWKDILSDDEECLSDEELLKYLNSTTGEQERRAIEEAAPSDFEKDALAGLQQMKNPEAVQQNVQQLNKSLRHQLKHRNTKRHKPKIDLRWSLLAVLLILFFCILAYIVLRMHQH